MLENNPKPKEVVTVPTEKECEILRSLNAQIIEDYCEKNTCNDDPEKAKKFVQATRRFTTEHPDYIYCLPLDY